MLVLLYYITVQYLVQYCIYLNSDLGGEHVSHLEQKDRHGKSWKYSIITIPHCIDATHNFHFTEAKPNNVHSPATWFPRGTICQDALPWCIRARGAGHAYQSDRSQGTGKYPLQVFTYSVYLFNETVVEIKAWVIYCTITLFLCTCNNLNRPLIQS